MKFRISLLFLSAVFCTTSVGHECLNWQWQQTPDGKCKWPYRAASNEEWCVETVLAVAPCMTGPHVWLRGECDYTDYDRNGRIDLKDWAYAETRLTKYHDDLRRMIPRSMMSDYETDDDH